MGPVLIVLAGDVDDGARGSDPATAATDGLLSATLDLARQVGGVGRVLLFHPPEAEARLATRALGFRLWPADGDSPGERYANAFRQAGELGYEGAVVIGLDVPQLPPQRLTEAVELLDQHQGVLVEDGRGGISVLGLQRHEPHLFPAGDEVPTAEVIRTRARQQLVRLQELEPHPALAPSEVDAYLASRSTS